VIGSEGSPQGAGASGFSESDWVLLEVVDLGVEGLQLGVVELESELRSQYEELGTFEGDQDRSFELAVVLDALCELKAAAREMRAWAASIGSRR